MTTISPTRVSMYDFLYQDIQPLTPLLADAANLSIPQTRLALTSSLQAILGALLGYHQRHQGHAVSKKLFSRAAVKELRQYNAMNFATLNSTLYHRHDVAEILFISNASIDEACAYIATQIDAKASQAKTLVNLLSIIILRELAILTDYSQLNHEELDKWFALQPQFLSAKRFETSQQKSIATTKDNKVIDNETTDNPILLNINSDNHNSVSTLANTKNNLKPSRDITISTPPVFDHYWYKLSGFAPQYDPSVQDMQQATSNYLKVIGRSDNNRQQGRHNDLLVFTEIPTIAVPHQRWLLQLAKISDIYLSRNRLRINSEPESAPPRPLVNLSLLSGNSDDTLATTSEKPIEYDTPKPLWKNPTILITIVVIAVLGALAFIKYKVKQADRIEPILLIDNRHTERTQQDVAIVKVDEETVTESNNISE